MLEYFLFILDKHVCCEFYLVKLHFKPKINHTVNFFELKKFDHSKATLCSVCTTQIHVYWVSSNPSSEVLEVAIQRYSLKIVGSGFQDLSFTKLIEIIFFSNFLQSTTFKVTKGTIAVMYALKVDT